MSSRRGCRLCRWVARKDRLVHGSARNIVFGVIVVMALLTLVLPPHVRELPMFAYIWWWASAAALTMLALAALGVWCQAAGHIGDIEEPEDEDEQK